MNPAIKELCDEIKTLQTPLQRKLVAAIQAHEGLLLEMDPADPKYAGLQQKLAALNAEYKQSPNYALVHAKTLQLFDLAFVGAPGFSDSSESSGEDLPPQTSDESPQPLPTRQLPSDDDPANMRRTSDETRRPALLDPTNIRREPDDTRRKDPRSPLDQLTPSQERFVLDLIDKHGRCGAADKLIMPPPEGLSLSTTEASLRLFEDRLENHEAKLDALSAQKLLDHLPPDATNAQRAAALMELHLIRAAHSPHQKTDQIAALTLAASRLRAAELADRKLTLAEKRLAQQHSSNTPAPSIVSL